MSVAGIVVAAGSGRRFGRPKHLIELGGTTLWERACQDLVNGGVATMIVVGDVPGGVPGGLRRQDSVAAGLAALASDAEFVVVHDAARPLAGAELVRAVVTRLAEGDVDGVIPVIEVRDTLKRVAGDEVVGTVDRSDLVAVQTPQGFKLSRLREAHDRVSDDVTDDAQMVELIGGTVAVVPGSPRNLKITYPADLDVAEALL